MNQFNTKIINLIGGPGCGKSIFAWYLSGLLKLNRENAEYVSEYAKMLVYLEKWEVLNNQHQVSTYQYELFKAINGKVDYIITDGSLLHGLHYNRINKDNMSNVKKTEQKILEYYNEFDNINIFINRREETVYEQEGRIQTEEEAKIIDGDLRKMLIEFDLKSFEFDNDINNIEKIYQKIKELS